MTNAPKTAPATEPNGTDTDVLVRTAGRLGRITLNRPKSINALSLEMVRQIQVGLDRFEQDDAITVVLLDGAGDRGLCAGGDIIALRDAAQSGEHEPAHTFWIEEYVLNARIASYPKPIVAIMDGVVMGGGIGLAGHASHRLATERLISAMPEVGIGFAPDVGGTWLLSRGDGELGTYVALTGARMGAEDAIAVGLADRVIASAAVAQLATDLESGDVEAAIAAAEAVAVEVPEGSLTANREWIDFAFGHDTVEEIIAVLEPSECEDPAKAVKAIRRASPTSLTVTLRALRSARELPSLEAALTQELRVSCGFLSGDDFVEGVRAQVVDKDRNPQWTPVTLEDVSDSDLDRYFAPLGAGDLEFNA